MLPPNNVYLPTSRAELEVFIVNLIAEYNLPDTDQTRGMICQEIMHMGRTVDSAPRHVFAAAVRKQLANDVAYPMIEEIRQKLEAERKAKLEETTKAETSNEQPVQDSGVQGS